MVRVDSNRVYLTMNTLLSWNLGNCLETGWEYLLYDFNLDTGTIISPDTVCTGIDVSLIDSVSLSNGAHIKKYSGADSSYWLWGISSSYGFLGYWWQMDACGPGPSEASQGMLCYSTPSVYYHFPQPAGTLQGDLQNNCFNVDTLLSIKNVVMAAGTLLIYPNPVTTFFTISASAKITTVAITNTLGQTVYNNQYNSPQIQVDVATLPAGIYFIRVNGTKVRKFVKE